MADQGLCGGIELKRISSFIPIDRVNNRTKIPDHGEISR